MFPQTKYRGGGADRGIPAQFGQMPGTPLTVLQPSVASQSRLDPKLQDKIESFLSKIKRGRFIPRAEESMSLLAAREATELLRDVVDHYARNSATQLENQVITAESDPTFKLGMRKRDYRAQIYEQTQEVINHVTAAGRQLQRTSAFKILLANATRKVLSILRNALSNATVTEQEFDRHYNALLDVAKANRRQKKLAEQSKAGGDAGIEGDLLESDGSEGSDPDSGDEDDAADWGWDGEEDPATGGVTGNKAAAGLGSQEVNSEGMIVGTPPTDGHHLPRVTSQATIDLQRARSKLRKPISLSAFYEAANNAIQDLISEDYESMTAQLCAHASLHVYSGELLVVYGCSHSTLSFLVAATEGKNFLVLILEGAPQKGASTLAGALAERGIGCRIVPDSSCFAVMSRASKVFVGAEAVLANGGVLAPIGTHMVCLAAQHHAVPVVVVTMSLKLCPYYPSDRHCTGLVKISRHEAKEMPWSTYGCPHDVLPFEAWARSADERSNQLQVHNPIMEYCPPDLVSLFVTDIGEYPPEDINRVVRDQYNAEDTHL